tara:strand:- start:885 stop:1511 length:627 start_codon:yes stop_codon:yes gene_type:complete
MKIKKLIKLLECIEGDYEGNLPQDMYDLGSYTRADDSRIGIDDMDFVHVMRAFKKMQSILAEDYDVGLQVSVSQTNQITKLEQEVSHLREKLVSEERARIMRIKDLKSINHDIFKKFNDLKERNAYLQERVEELIPVKAYPKYDFCEVPNDCEGQEFIDNVKKYLNTNKYKMRVRGQHVKDEYKGTGATAYGQNIEQSTHLRVYIEEK